MLTVQGNQFVVNGRPFQILSGAIHYFRVVPEYWEDRLLKLKHCGLNTVETYIPWNLHEPKKGQFHFTGIADLEAFVRLAESLGLYVILRPSPYICAEWEFGGLPAWLLKEKDIELRCSHPAFLQHIEEYYDELIPRIKPLLSTNGGPVLAVQIENEYGGYGNDKTYLAFLRDALQKRGVDVLLFTSDGPDMLADGSLPDVLATVNFGSRPDEAFQKLKAFQPGRPLMCMEFWDGWFDHWTGEHHVRDGKDVADTLEQMLEMGASVNFYMFHGGTNFAFYNGANHYETYTPTITSYDYDSLLSESGDITPKYEMVKKVLAKYAKRQETKMPATSPKKAYGTVELTESISLFDTLPAIGKTVRSPYPLTMEQLDQSYGFTLYKTTIDGKGRFEMDITPVRDRAFIYVNRHYQKTVSRRDENKFVMLDFPQEINSLEILVENMGRVNYGKNLKDSKGMAGNLWINNKYVFDWEMTAIELDRLPVLFKNQKENRYPKFFRGILEIQEDAAPDTFVQLDGWTKGNVFINGFNLGRYWSVGPQATLYLPGPLLKKGKNELVVLELEGNRTTTISLAAEPNLG
ncbi:glycoside hydrolase family 35 protein [Heyndrickxia acidicola]|uniref:Beta-galactosidase n=1 Tax=Heyndrickxia acidicola TaxID=209389 RepID=A0ABU6MIA3_9BACI|nr:beta-galactosidase [Heyndrickxia acidicola]MED1203383.1 beta-galactosidase [Heyndrickxia acidicola]